MPQSFDLLWERLLRGGVSRRHARRYLVELGDHLQDLVAEERAGAEPRSAETRALARLGNPETLAGAMIARRELRGLAARAPIATYVIAPPLALAAGAALAMVGIVATATALRNGGAALPAWVQTAADAGILFSNGLLPVLLGWALGVVALRQRSAAFWPVLGMVVLGVAGAVLQLDVTLPSAGHHGEIGLATGLGPTFAQWSGPVGRLALNLALTVTPYAWLSSWRAARASEGRTYA
jgi:hypothetical protein